MPVNGYFRDDDMARSGRRRILLAGAAALVVPAARAQPQRQSARVGIVFNTLALGAVGGERPREPLMREFLLGLRDDGWVEGRNIVIERRSAEGKLDRLESIVRELSQLPVDVIVVSGNAATLAAKKATSTVPIVSSGMTNPVETGIVSSLAHPGGNVTGIVPAFGNELAVKRVELLRELLPRARRVAYFGTNVTAGPAGEVPEEVLIAAKAMGLALTYVDARLPDLSAGLAQLAREGADALIAVPSVPLYPHRQVIVEFAAAARLPDIHGFREAVEAGGLASYGGDTYQTWRRTARFVHRILSGAKPGDLPVEKTDRYWMMLNAGRARALGIVIPPALRQRADEVIE